LLQFFSLQDPENLSVVCKRRWSKLAFIMNEQDDVCQESIVTSLMPALFVFVHYLRRDLHISIGQLIAGEKKRPLV
jgi:hypothetical protein